MNRRNHIVLPLWAVFVCLFFCAAAWAAPDPGTDNFTRIMTQGQIGGNFPNFSDHTLDGSTLITTEHHYDTSGMPLSWGMLDGQGFADFGTLKSRVELEGPSGLEARSSANFVDHWTISSLHHSPGDPGTLQLAFQLSGLASILDTGSNPVLDDSFASVNLMVDKDPTNSSTGTRYLDFSQDLGTGSLQINPTPSGPTVTAPIDFFYGTPFGLSVTLRTSGLSDNGYLFTTFSPYYEYYGGGTIDSIVVDFLSTAELTDIVIPDGAGARVLGLSGTIYSDLVTTELQPVPLPPAVWLFASGLAGLWGLKRTIRSRGC